MRRRDRRLGVPQPRRAALAVRKAASLVLEAFEARLMLDGSSFTGAYYNNADLSSPVLSRADAAINFDWGKSAPAAGVDPSTFSVRWTGYVKPAFSESYTFYTTADDGVRLWVNEQAVVDGWAVRTDRHGAARGV